MRQQAPFQLDDLRDLETLFDLADRVVPMREIAAGETSPGVVAVRHDCDNEIETAVEMALWEYRRLIRSTYFIEHTAPYWHQKDTLRAALETIAGCGHEVGLHLNAISEAIKTGRDPLDIAYEAVTELRGYGHDVTGVVAHGDPLCHQHGFVNDELFTESARPDYGAPDRAVAGVRLEPVSRRWLGFTYDPNWLPRGMYLSDSGGRWSQPFTRIANHEYEGQLHMLVHPCWWADALATERIAA